MRCVVTDETGSVLVGKSLTDGTHNVAELWAICEAVLYAKNCGIDQIEIYRSSQTALAWIRNNKAKTTHQQRVMNLLYAVSNLCRQIKMTTTWMQNIRTWAAPT